MSGKSRFTNREKEGIKGAAWAVGLGLCFLLFPLGKGLRHLSYELPFRFQDRPPVNEAVIVYMDEASHRILNQPYDEPWDRRVHAELLQGLTGWGAKAVVFDLLFDRPTDPEQDRAFAEAIRKNGRVVLAAVPSPQQMKNGPVVWKLLVPFDELAKVASWGVVETTLASDPVARQHFVGASEEPSLAWRTAELTMTNPPPARPDKARWINHYGAPFTIPHYSYHQVLSNDIPQPGLAFSNKVVFVGTHVNIGYSAGRPSEYWRTPYSLWSEALAPGVEVNATIYLNLLRSDWLVELPPLIQLLLLVTSGLVFGYGLSALRPIVAVGWAVAGILVVGVLSVLWVGLTRVWTPWLIMAVVQVPVALGWSVLSQTRKLSVHNETLEAALAGLRSMPPADGSTAPLRQPVSASPAASPFPAASPGAATRIASSGESTPVPDHELLRRIGEGAYGQVWLARNVIGTYHAVKVVRRGEFRSTSPFEREFRGIQKFTPISREHPGFVHVLHVGINPEEGYFYCIMELGDDEVSGQQIDPQRYVPKNLDNELRRRRRLPVEECLQLGLDLSNALKHLHQHRLIHRDIKPSNIIFVNGTPKLADIGLVTEIAVAGRDVSYLGTEGYMAPEGPGRASSDVYSLGKVIYEALTGLDRRRFPELPTEMVSRAESRLTLHLNKILLKACEKEIPARYQSAAELHDALLELKQEGTSQRKPWFRKWKK